MWFLVGDGTWHRVSAKNVSPRLLGVVRGRDKFDFLYRATLPEITESARMWLPLATSDRFQTVTVKEMRTPGKRRVLEEPEHGNKILFLEFGPEHSGEVVEIVYHVERLEKAAYEAEAPDPARYLSADRLVPIGGDFSAIALEVTEGKKTDLRRARAIYDHVIDRMSYIKHGSGWGQGDAVYACDVRTGNCTDFHAYFIALARSVGIPARFAIGAGIPSERNDGGVDGYHCWVEFYADGKWWPVDISEADKYSSLSTYFFGHHPANRIELSRGRDIEVEPGPASGPINFLAYPVLEIGGKRAETKVVFAFERKESGGSKSGGRKDRG
ncbi:MAG: transglutaminase domain-containing protein [Candidatus Brocadiia bacterium]